MSSHKSTKKDAGKVTFQRFRFAAPLCGRSATARRWHRQQVMAGRLCFGRCPTGRHSPQTLKLCSLAVTTQEEYLRYVRKLAARVKRDPAELKEAQLRAHLLHLKDGQGGHGYSASSRRTAVAAFTAFYNLHLGRDWKLFRLVRSPSPQTLPTVLTRDEVKKRRPGR